MPDLSLPGDREFSPNHTWARREEDGTVRLGVTHVPLAFLGDAVYVELPPAGIEIAAGEPVGLVESSSAVFEVVSPASGVVAEVNPVLENAPERVTEDPYGEGWLLALAPSEPPAPGTLLSPEEYAARNRE